MNNENPEFLMAKGDKLLDDRCLEEASVLYRQVVAMDNRHADAHFMLGVIAEERSDTGEAERQYVEALESDTNHAEAHLGLARVLLQKGDTERALTHATRATELADDCAEAWLVFGYLQARNGLMEAAEASVTRAARLCPANSLAHLQLGEVFRQRGNLSEAAQAYAQALDLEPRLTAACLGLAQVQLAQGELDGAEATVNQLIDAQQRDAGAWFIRGVARAKRGDLKAACHDFREALELEPEHVPAAMNLVTAYLKLDNPNMAIDTCRTLLSSGHGNAEIHAGYAQALNRLGRYAEARTSAEAGLALRSGHEPCLLSLADALAGTGHADRAEQRYLQVLSINPSSVEARFRLGHFYQQRGRVDAAVRCLEETVRLASENAYSHLALASAFQLQGRLDEAMVHCNRALTLQPGMKEAIARCASILEHQGDLQAAFDCLMPLIHSASTTPAVALVYARLCQQLGRAREGIALLEGLLSRDELLPTSRDKIHKTLARLYDSTGSYEQAFTHNMRACALRHSRFEPDGHDQEIEVIMASLDRSALERISNMGDPSQRPVFIVGMPRSGTSLVEQILASHPAIYGAGELPDIPELSASLAALTGSDCHYPTRLIEADKINIMDHAHRYLARLAQLNRDATRVTDKLPHNFLYLGVIQTLLPRARVIHVRRDAMDTCLSCYLQDFSSAHDYAYDLTHIGRYYRAYLRVMDHWRRSLDIALFELEYEELVEAPERLSRALVEFCGLPWDDRCMRFHESTRTVNTPSYHQVRRPVYQSSVQRWRHYEPWLQPLRDALGHEYPAFERDRFSKP